MLLSVVRYQTQEDDVSRDGGRRFDAISTISNFISDAVSKAPTSEEGENKDQKGKSSKLTKIDQKSNKRYITPAFDVLRPKNTFITIDQALEYSGDNSTYSKRCLYVLMVAWTVNSFLTMGWPLYFHQGNSAQCAYQDGRIVTNCNLETACTETPNPVITLVGDNTLIKKFSLFCERSSGIYIANEVLFGSQVLSGFFFSIISDLKGRRFGLIAATALSFISVTISCFVDTFAYWQICMGFAGFGLSGVEIISLVYVSEISGKRYRKNAVVLLTFVWGVSQVLNGMVLGVIRDWRYAFLLTISAPSLICCFFHYFMFLETPRYLLSVGRISDAKKVINKITVINRRPPFEFRLMNEIEIENEMKFSIPLTTYARAMKKKKSKYIRQNQSLLYKSGVLELNKETSRGNKAVRLHRDDSMKSKSKSNPLAHKTRNIYVGKAKDFNLLISGASQQKIKTIIMVLLWSIRYIIYYGLTIDVSQFGKHIFLNFTVMGLSELAGSLLTSPLIARFNRKSVMQLSITLCGLSCLAIHLRFSQAILAMISKLAITVFYGVLIAYTAELYPTDMRSQAYGILMTSGRLATLFIPILSYSWTFYTQLPSLLMFALCCFIALVGLFFLEETYSKGMNELETRLIVKDEVELDDLNLSSFRDDTQNGDHGEEISFLSSKNNVTSLE